MVKERGWAITLHRVMDAGIYLASFFYASWDPSLWNGATHFKGGSSHRNELSLGSPPQMRPRLVSRSCQDSQEQPP